MEWKMPDLGEGVQEGEIVKWRVAPGGNVSADEPIVDIMTDKATIEVSAPVDGVLKEIRVEEGGIAKIGQTLAVIEEGGAVQEAPPTAQKDTEKEREQPAETKSAPPQKPMPSRSPTVRPELVDLSAGSLEEGRTTALASPAVRRLAREKGIELSRVRGSGPHGRILKADLERGPSVVRQAHHEQASLEAPLRKSKEHIPAVTVAAGQEERRPLRGMRRKIAEHMVLSRKTAAHFTHVDEADLTELVILRENAKKGAKDAGIRLTYLPYFIKAVLYGLKRYPQANASLLEESQEIVYKGYYHIGIAVDTPNGLIVPNIKNADRRSLFDIAQEANRLGSAARENKIQLQDLKGGTFTVTNVGAIGGLLSAPIINYPEVAIMGLHQIQPRVVVREGRAAVRQMMYITVSADHRVLDGADVARFLKDVIEVLEHPAEFAEVLQ